MITQEKIRQSTAKLILVLEIPFGLLALFFYFIELPLLYTINPAMAESIFVKVTPTFLIAVILLFFIIRILPTIGKKTNDYADKLDESIKNETVK